MSQQQYPQNPQNPQYPSQAAPPAAAPPTSEPTAAQPQQPPMREPTAAQPQQPPMREPTAAQPQQQGEEAIWDGARADEFRQRWHEIQTHFVEDPQGSVAEARQVVGDAVRSLADNVHEREEELARRGARASDSTEGMRDTVLQYHRLLEQVLSV